MRVVDRSVFTLFTYWTYVYHCNKTQAVQIVLIRSIFAFVIVAVHGGTVVRSTSAWTIARRIDPNNVHALSAWGRLGEKPNAVDGATRAQRKPPPT